MLFQKWQKAQIDYCLFGSNEPWSIWSHLCWKCFSLQWNNYDNLLNQQCCIYQLSTAMDESKKTDWVYHFCVATLHLAFWVQWRTFHENKCFPFVSSNCVVFKRYRKWNVLVTDWVDGRKIGRFSKTHNETILLRF